MKHNVKITIVILLMFLLAQFVGLYVVNSYATEKVIDGKIVNNTGKVLPYGMGIQTNDQTLDTGSLIFSFLFSLVIVIAVVLILVKIKARFIMKTWFYLVSLLALGISFTAILPEIKYASWIALAISLPLVYFKVYKRNLVFHNFTELLIYPGIAAIFVPILGIFAIIVLLVLISIYDMWAVWKSKVMQKMANYYINELNVFGGFFIPYASKKVKEKIRSLKLKSKSKEELQKKFKKLKLNINVGILGGGDIAYSILSSGVVLKTWGILPAIVVILGALLGLTGLLLFSEKKKMYPAMPFISAGIFLGMAISWFFLI